MTTAELIARLRADPAEAFAVSRALGMVCGPWERNTLPSGYWSWVRRTSYGGIVSSHGRSRRYMLLADQRIVGLKVGGLPEDIPPECGEYHVGSVPGSDLAIPFRCEDHRGHSMACRGWIDGRWVSAGNAMDRAARCATCGERRHHDGPGGCCDEFVGEEEP